MKNRLLAAVVQAVLVAALISSPVYADPPAAAQSSAPQLRPTGGHGGGIFIAAWDADGDGKVSRAEYDAARTQRFAQADENSDATLSADEYVNEYAVRLDAQIAEARKGYLEQTHTRFRALDKGRDGIVSRAEYDASGDRAFIQLDHDKDGRIAGSDPGSATEMPRAKNAAERSKQAQRPTRERPVIAMPTTHTRAGFLELYDTDADEVVTRAQYDTQRASAFSATATNGDGKLDENEYTDEFADRLDRRIARTRQAQLEQGHVRFESIDGDKTAGISREEYLSMSARMFDRLDTNKDGAVAENDPPPPVEERRERTERNAATTATAAAQP